MSKEKRTQVHILLDASGSMTGQEHRVVSGATYSSLARKTTRYVRGSVVGQSVTNFHDDKGAA